jgi:excisionase family DNA binding protein
MTQPPSTPPVLLTIKEFAAIVRVHEDTAKRWAARGEVRCVRIGGVVRIDASEASRFDRSSDR